MWVIIDTETGREIDRVESDSMARNMVAMLNREADYDHFGKRWES